MALTVVAFAGCTLIPNDGPNPRKLKWGAYDRVKNRHTPKEERRVNYILIDVNKRIVQILHQAGEPEAFAGKFTSRGPAADIRIGVGDTIGLTIFEAGAGGLFTPTGVTLSQGNFVTVADQQIDARGTIKAPYAGWIKAVGRYPEELEREIERKLKNRAIEPQVVVNVKERESNLVSVNGDVNEGGRFNITLNGLRVLDAISLAQGAKFQDFETLVTLQRGREEATVRLSAITRDPTNNIYLQPKDVLFVQRDQRFFTVFGATDSRFADNQSRRYEFDQEVQTVADGLARAGGLTDEIADPRWLVLYRAEKRETVEAMGGEIPPQYASSVKVPVIYKFNVRHGDGYFFAKNMRLRNNDLLYATNARIIGWLKLNSYIRDYNATTNLPLIDMKNARDAMDHFGVNQLR